MVWCVLCTKPFPKSMVHKFRNFRDETKLNFDSNTKKSSRKMDIDGLEKDCSNSIANPLGLLQSCTKLSIWKFLQKKLSILFSFRCVNRNVYFTGYDYRLREAESTVFTDDECYEYWGYRERYGLYNPKTHICVGVVGKVGACSVSSWLFFFLTATLYACCGVR